MIKSRRMRWTGHMAFLGQIRSAYAVLVREDSLGIISQKAAYISKHLDKLYLIHLTHCRSNLNPYCMGRKAGFFSVEFKFTYMPVRLITFSPAGDI
jgi:hypothetical protein